jgi:hypothetical protein
VKSPQIPDTVFEVLEVIDGIGEGRGGIGPK